MPSLATCPQGHSWECPPTQPGETAKSCPICGAVAIPVPPTLLTSPPGAETPPTHTLTPETHPPAVEQVPPTRLSFPTAGEQSATVPVAPLSGVQVPGYEILRELGRGGMGVVYEAMQIKLNRRVALKMILHGGHAGKAARDRFRTEAEAIARLQHPHIVQIHEIGECEGLPFFSLEFCSGGTLANKLKGIPLPPMEAAALVETLARAMDAAHQAGVVHRDLKPANVLLDKDGQPKVTDFGLAKKVDEVGQTGSGAVMGTPSYMAPEQAGGHSKEVGPAADVWALGTILYECLTGRPPFKAATTMQTLMQVIGDDPVPPTRLNAKVPRDLEVVCVKCLRKEAPNRYDSALDLAEELRRFRAGEPIKARPAGRLERTVRWCRRNPAVAALLFLVALALTAGTAVSLYFGFDASEQARRANAKVKEANEALSREAEALRREKEEGERRKKLLSEAARSYCDWGDREIRAGNVRDGLNWMLRAHETAPEDDRLRPSYARLLVTPGQSLGRVLPHQNMVTCVAFSPDGRLALTGSRDKTARLWDVATGKQIALLQHEGEVNTVAFSPDGRLALTGSDDWTARLWDVATGKQAALLQDEGKVTAVAFSPDGRLALTGSDDWTALLWDVATGKQTARLEPGGRVAAVALSQDGRLALTGSSNSKARVWDVTTGKETALLQHEDEVRAVAFSPDGRLALTGSKDRTARLWEVATGKQTALLQHDGEVYAVAFSPDGRRALTGSWDKTARLWDVATGKQIAVLQHEDFVLTVAFSPDGWLALTGSEDRTARLWDVFTGKQTALLLHEGDVRAVAFSPDGRLALTGSRDKTARLWDVATGKQTALLEAWRRGGCRGVQPERPARPDR